MRRRTLLTGALAAPLAGLPREVLAQTPTPPTIDELMAVPVVMGAALSPNGEKIAVIKQRKEGDKWVGFVSLTTTANLDAVANVGLGAARLKAIQWKNDERLLVSLQFGALLVLGGLMVIPKQRLGVLSADGKSFKLLFEDQPALLQATTDLARVIDLLPNDPRCILMMYPDIKRGVPALFKVDVYSGQAELVERGTGATAGWLTQDGLPMIRMDISRVARSTTYFGRAPGETEWKKLREVRQTEVDRLKQDFEILGPTEQPGVFLVSTMTEIDEARTLRKYDIRTLGFGEVVSHRPGRDAIGHVRDVTGKYVAATYQDDRIAYDFTDPTMNAHLKELEGLFQNQCSIDITGVSADGGRWIVKATGPRDLGAYVFFDRKKGEIGLLGVRQPSLTRDRLASVEMLDVMTRDGSVIRAYLTVPLAAGRRPLVVLPHGGPEVRDVYEFDLLAQTLAAQGWFVLQPNFRGSGGYGRAFADAGRRQFNGTVMDDIEDSIDQVLASGRMDPARVAICGGSFGGYAALMGAVRRPDAYKAVVSISGVSDLQRAVEDMRRYPKSYEYWLKTAGDPKADEAMMLTASPLKRAAEIKAPVLLIHGKDDVVVGSHHSKDMAGALRRAQKVCEYLELPDAGHNWDSDNAPVILKKTVEFLGAKLA